MTVGSIISGGFGLLRERPGPVAVWGLIYLATTVLLGLAMRPVMGPLTGAGDGNPMAAAQFASNIGWFLLLELATLVIFTVLLAAAQRAILYPEREGFFYLRLGLDELRLFGLALLLIVLFYIGLLVAAIVLSLIVGIVAVAVGPAAAVPLMFVEMIVILGLILWFQVRLSLAFPLTLLRGKIVIGEAWRSTRGRFWTLFGAFFLIFLMLLVLWFAVAMVNSGGYFSDLMQSGLTPEGLERAGRRQMERQFGTITPLMILGWALTAIAGTVSLAVFGGAIATAARESVEDVDGLAETFA